jgi:hypothetical protein
MNTNESSNTMPGLATLISQITGITETAARAMPVSSVPAYFHSFWANASVSDIHRAQALICQYLDQHPHLASFEAFPISAYPRAVFRAELKAMLEEINEDTCDADTADLIQQVKASVSDFHEH